MSVETLKAVDAAPITRPEVEDFLYLEAALLDEIARLQNAPSPEAPEPERIEVPVLPAGVADTMAELAARAEALAEEVEEKAGK